MAETPKRVDRAEIAKRVERAEKYLQKGKATDAVEEYLQVLQDDPDNDTVRQMAADLCLSLNRNSEASTLLGELFERQVASGDATRASLTYKKLARFVNPTWEQKVRYGQILEPSNKKLAVEAYESALEQLSKQGKTPEALPVLKRLVALEPTERNHLRLGEMSSQAGENQAAAASFLRAAELARAEGANAAPWYERAYAEDSSNPQVVLAYGKNLLEQGEVGAAIFIFEPHVSVGEAAPEFREAYAKGLLAAHRLADAEPFVWQLFEQDVTRMQQVVNLIGAMLDAQQDAEAVALARKLEQHQRRKGERRSFLAIMQDLVASHRPSPEMLEFLSDLFNASNREADYCATLLKLFDLQVSLGNFPKAGECLDRAAEVDPYESGHQKRLDLLRGKIEENRFKVIAARFTSATKADGGAQRSEEPTLGAAALQDLMLQAEILVQYGMRSKAIERLQRIQELFPREEERNEDLHRLYLAAGMTPRYAGAVPAPPPPPVSSDGAGAWTGPPGSGAPAPPAHTEAADVSSLMRVAEITRKLYRQGNANAVLSTAAFEIGSQWKVTRCVAAMRKPGLPPTTMQEYCGEGMAAAGANALAQLVATAQDLAAGRGSLTITDAPAAPELQAVREAVAELSVSSLLVLSLADGADQVGVLLLMQSTPRGWHSNDLVVLKTLSEQIVISLNNAGLRRLVKNLSVTDEKSGLLKRASYLDLLLAETRRAAQQGTPLTVLLMQFGRSAAMVKEAGEPAVEALMEQIGQLFAANIRQNDQAFRYEVTTIALVLGETAEPEALLAVEKLRRLLAGVYLPGTNHPVSITAGLAETVMRQNYDPVDIVTEVINRAEQALAKAIARGPGAVVTLQAKSAAAAVA